MDLHNRKLLFLSGPEGVTVNWRNGIEAAGSAEPVAAADRAGSADFHGDSSIEPAGLLSFGVQRLFPRFRASALGSPDLPLHALRYSVKHSLRRRPDRFEQGDPRRFNALR
jgi:hypothetical protein